MSYIRSSPLRLNIIFILQVIFLIQRPDKYIPEIRVIGIVMVRYVISVPHVRQINAYRAKSQYSELSLTYDEP